MNKLGKIILGIILVIFVIGVITFMGGIIIYNNSLKPYTSEENGKDITIEIPEKTRVKEIAQILEDNSVIKNALVFQVYLKLNNQKTLQAGKYVFNNGKDDIESIAEKLNKGQVFDESIKITFIEGKNMKYVAKTIAENTNNTEEDVFNLLKDEEYLDEIIEKYWFLNGDEIKDERIYYSLEGYLLPDTYTFESKDVSVKEIFNKILEYTDKYLSSNREKIEETGLTVHQLLTLASIAELEGSTLEERQKIISVFYNRLDKGMSLGSDVTTYYAVGKELSDGDLTAAEIKTESPYNTRAENMQGYIPVGPIDNPSKISIEAVIEPEETSALYFVSDKNGKVYFTDSYPEHQALIQNLKDSNLWYTY